MKELQCLEEMMNPWKEIFYIDNWCQIFHFFLILLTKQLINHDNNYINWHENN